MNRYRDAARCGMKTFFENMKTQCESPKQEEKKEEKVEEPVVEEPEIAVKFEEPAQEKKEQVKEEEKPFVMSEDDLLLDAANYLSEVLGQSFNSSIRYAKRFPGLTKEEILMNYMDGK